MERAHLLRCRISAPDVQRSSSALTDLIASTVPIAMDSKANQEVAWTGELVFGGNRRREFAARKESRLTEMTHSSQLRVGTWLIPYTHVEVERQTRHDTSTSLHRT